MKKWLIRNSKGRLFGPFTTDEVLTKITHGDFSGEEMISLYPGGEWRAISKEPDFYNHLLNMISGVDVDPPAPPPIDEDLTPAPENSEDNNSEPEVSAHTETYHTTKDFQTKTHQEREIIHMKPLSEVKNRKKNKKLVIPLFLIAAALLMLVLLLPPAENKTPRLELLVPKKTNKTLISKKDEKKLIKKALINFTKDTYKNYVSAQEQFIKIIEKSPKSSGAYALLCLTYNELWSFTEKSSRELSAVSAVQQRVSIIDPLGLDSATCRVVQNILSENYKEANEQVEGILNKYADSAQPPIAFYYFKALLLDRQRDYLTAANYLSSVQKMWPTWIRLFSYEAHMLRQAKEFSGSARRYVDILKANPKHKEARLILGVLEYEVFQHPERAKSYIEQALNLKDKVDSHTYAQAYRVLSQIYLAEQNREQAIRYAKESIYLNPFDEKTKKLLKSLGQESLLNKPKLKDRELVYYGDQFLRDGDCNAAQAHYKSAYELNPKNAIAAYKAGKCLWELSLSSEAIIWLDKATRANPKYIEAQILLADYYSQRYNYELAAKVLGHAIALNPTSYEVFRGYALVEFRRNNFTGAINYAKKALALYEADVDSLVIMAESLINLSKASEAFYFAAKAIEINSMHKNAQSIYAIALSDVQGVDTAVQYLEKIVSQYPLRVEYRIALGRVYMEDQQYISAAEVFVKATDIDENHKAGFMGLGDAYKYLDKLTKAQSAYLKAAVLDPSDVAPIFKVGLMYFENNKFKEAYKQFIRVQSVNPSYPGVHYYLGKTSLNLRNYAEAIKFAKKEQEYNPGLVDSYILMGDIYGQQGDHQRCIKEFQQAIKLRPQGAQIYVKMAVCYSQSGNHSVAMTMLKQAESLENGLPDVYRELGNVYRAQGDYDDAVRAYRMYIELAPNAVDRELIRNAIDGIIGQ